MCYGGVLVLWACLNDNICVGVTQVMFQRFWCDLCSSECSGSEQSQSHLKSVSTQKYSSVFPPCSPLQTVPKMKEQFCSWSLCASDSLWNGNCFHFYPRLDNEISWWYCHEHVGETGKKRNDSDQALRCVCKDVDSLTKQRRKQAVYNRILFIEQNSFFWISFNFSGLHPME